MYCSSVRADRGGFELVAREAQLAWNHACPNDFSPHVVAVRPVVVHVISTPQESPPAQERGLQHGGLIDFCVPGNVLRKTVPATLQARPSEEVRVRPVTGGEWLVRVGSSSPPGYSNLVTKFPRGAWRTAYQGPRSVTSFDQSLHAGIMMFLRSVHRAGRGLQSSRAESTQIR